MARGARSGGGRSTRQRSQGRRAANGVDLDAAGFARALRQATDGMVLDSEDALRRVAVRVQNEARKLAPVDTGRLRASITHSIARTANGPVARIRVGVAYGAFVEYGTERSPAQPYLRPALVLAARWWTQEAGR